MGEKGLLLMKYMGNFSNTKCNESPAICSLKKKKSQDNVKLLEEMMIFKKKTAKRNAFELRGVDRDCFCRWSECF